MRHLICFLLAIVMLAGCASVKVKDPEKPVHYDEDYDYTDLHAFTHKITQSAINSQPLASAADKPVVVIYGLRNRTDEHIDVQAVTDAIRAILHKSDKVRFAAKEQRDQIEQEIDYQQSSGNVDKDTQIRLARQVGARYMLTGTIYSISKQQMKQVRFKKRELKWFKLTMELTDLESGLIAWTDEVEIARESGKPLIGW